MTPAQQSALEAVVGRPLSAEEVATIDALLADRNDVEIAAVLTAGQPPQQVSLAVEDVFDVLFSSGDYMTLKQAQLTGDATAIMAFAVLEDSKRIGSGKVNLQLPLTVALLDQLTAAGLLSAAGRAALDARATILGAPIHYNTVSDALNIAEGRLTLHGG